MEVVQAGRHAADGHRAAATASAPSIDEYRVQSRGGVGIINIQTSERNGLVVGVAYVQAGDELLLITQQGMILRMQTDDVRVDRPRDAGRDADRHRGGRQGRLDRAAGREGRRRADAGRRTAGVGRESRTWRGAAGAAACRAARRQPSERCSTQFFAASRLRDLTALQQDLHRRLRAGGGRHRDQLRHHRSRGRCRVETGVDRGAGAIARRPDGVQERCGHHPARADYGDQ